MSALNLLEYRSYVYNRKKYPQFAPEDYQFLFANWEEYEKLYKEERKEKEKNK